MRTLLFLLSACGDPTTSPLYGDADGDGSPASADCDEDSMIQTYADADGDGYGDAGDVGALACDLAGGRVTDHTDCDDTSAEANPGIAAEVCGDGVDNDCDGTPGGCGLYGEVSLSEADARISGRISQDDGLGSAGDLNGDGFGDIFVGGSDDDDDAAAWVLYGPVAGDRALSTAEVHLFAADEDEQAGTGPLAGPGDLNGDGAEDLLVPAPYRDEGHTNNGVVYVVYGPVSGAIELSGAHTMIVGAEDYDHVGSEGLGAADVNGDEVVDVLVGSNNDAGGEEAGAVYLVHGPVTGDVDLGRADAKLIGEDYADFAEHVGSAGDVDGDGLTDVLVGAGGGRGAVYLMLSPFTGTIDLSAADAKVTYEPTQIGEVFASADLDADGYADLAVGSADGAWVVNGPYLGDLDLEAADARLLGEDGALWSTWALASPGDFDGDGPDDLAIGTPADDADWRGWVYVLYGPVAGAVDISEADLRLRGTEPRGGAGQALGAAGDVDADGLGDLLIGSEYVWGDDPDSRADAGAYLVYGRARY